MNKPPYKKNKDNFNIIRFLLIPKRLLLGGDPSFILVAVSVIIIINSSNSKTHSH